MSRVAAVIVTYNARAWVPDCLRSVREHATQHHLQLAVLDNASSDFTLEELSGWAGPDAHVMRSAENLGFGRGCNQAVRETESEYIMLVNPDAILEPGAVDAMVALIESDDTIGIVGGRVTAPDGRLDRGSCFGPQTLYSLLCFATGLSTAFPLSELCNPEGLGRWQRDSIRRVGIVTGCLLLMSRRLWEELEGFDETFFMYGEDADLCMRAAALGQSSWITPDARLVHALGASSTTLLSKQVLLFRGKATLVNKSSTGPSRWIQLGLLQLGVGLRALGERLTRTDRGAWRGLWVRRRDWRRGW